jgi:hypothetical protein
MVIVPRFDEFHGKMRIEVTKNPVQSQRKNFPGAASERMSFAFRGLTFNANLSMLWRHFHSITGILARQRGFHLPKRLLIHEEKDRPYC